jgi:hypothetical protein
VTAVSLAPQQMYITFVLFFSRRPLVYFKVIFAQPTAIARCNKGSCYPVSRLQTALWLHRFLLPRGERRDCPGFSALRSGGPLYFICIFVFFIDFFNAFFWRFVTRGVQKHEKNFFSKKSIWAHHKECGFFSPISFFFPLGCLVRFFLSRFWAFRSK